MKKLLILCTLFYFPAYAETPEKLIQVQVNMGLAQGDEKVESGPLTSSKTMAAVAVGAATGGALYFGTVFSKNYDAFSHPMVYMMLASVLLYSQRDVVKTYLGSAYTSIASLSSMLSLVATGAVSELLLKAKRIVGYAKKEQPENEKKLAKLVAE